MPFSTLTKIKTAVNNIVSLNRPFYDVALTGGEPTIHPHIFELISTLHGKLGERLNSVSITTNGSRNALLYENLADIAKYLLIRMNVSIHTDHVEMDHILDLIEKLSHNVRMNFLIMFNPDKREFVHEIYETLFEYRKKFQFSMNIILLRNGDRVDSRHTQEDFEWQKKANAKFAELVRSVAPKFPALKPSRHPIRIFHEVEENGEKRIIPLKNRALNMNNGLLNFTGMYCISYSHILEIEESGLCRGMVCRVDSPLCNIYDENCFKPIRDKLIHGVKCPHHICGCIVNDRIPKFASEEDAKKYVEFAQKRQAELFAEYDAAHAIKKTI